MIQNIILAITAIIALLQFRQSIKARYADIMLSIFENLYDSGTLLARNTFFASTIEETPSKDIEKACTVTIDSINRLCYLADWKMIPRKYILSLYSGLIIQTWKHGEKFIKRYRISSGKSNYADSIEHLVPYAYKFRTRRKYDTIIL